MANPAERSAARLAAVQALYQMDVSGKGLVDVMAEFEAHWMDREIEGITFQPAETSFFRELLSGTVEEQRTIDTSIDRALSDGWPLTRIETVLRAILRVGAYEITYRRDVPVRVSITEYVEIAHGFYAADEPGLVNAVLDTIARDVRPGELAERARRAGARPAGA